MKIIAIGDIHGSTLWKEIVLKHMAADKIVFIGDYFDNYSGTSFRDQINNFLDIIEFKKANMQRVKLLFGNHDFHYIYPEHYSGYQALGAVDIGEAINTARKDNLIQMCYIATCGKNEVLFVHAGVSKTWCKDNNIVVDDYLEERINLLFKSNPEVFRFTKGQKRNIFGDEWCQTPIWIRPISLKEDKVDGYIQVVGHTSQKKLKKERDVIFIDCLQDSRQYLVITDKEFIAMSTANEKTYML